MTREETFFVQVLSDHLNGRKTTVRPDLEWDVLCSCAAKHQVNGILYKQCSSFLPGEAEKLLSRRHAAELYYYFKREALFAQLSERLSAADIPFYTVKGLEVARFYPVPSLRTMGDCDIVVHPEDKERAHAELLAMGLANEQKNLFEWTYVKDDLEIELHDHLLYDATANTQADQTIMDMAWDFVRPAGSGTRYVLDWSFHFLFLVLHLKKHLIHSGAGFRQFMDLAVVMRHGELDWSWLERHLAELELVDFARVCFALLGRWFGISAPLPEARISDAFYDEATEKVLANGVFGFDDAMNSENTHMHIITQQNAPRILARALYLLRNLFPPYRNMRYVPYYAFLNGRPWLLPAAWAYRFYHTLRTGKGEHGRKVLRSALISNERLEARSRELEKWGLR